MYFIGLKPIFMREKWHWDFSQARYWKDVTNEWCSLLCLLELNSMFPALLCCAAFEYPMPCILPALTHFRLCCPFTASLPHLTCLGLGQQISSASWNFPSHSSLPLWLHPWPHPASFFTSSTTSQPSLAAFFTCFGMNTQLQLVGEVVWRGRGGEQLVWPEWEAKHLFVSLGYPRDASMVENSGVGKWEMKAFYCFCKWKVKPEPEFCTMRVSVLDHSQSCPAPFSQHMEAHQCCGQGEHSKRPLTISWWLLRFHRNSLSKAMCYKKPLEWF